MRVVIGAEDQNTRDHVQQVLSRLSGEDVVIVPLPKRVRDVTDPEDSDTREIGDAVLTCSADLGFVIDEDMRQFAAIDEEGELVTTADVARFLDPAALPVTATITSAARILFGDSSLTFRSQAIQCAATLALAHLVTTLSRQSGRPERAPAIVESAPTVQVALVSAD